MRRITVPLLAAALAAACGGNRADDTRPAMRHDHDDDRSALELSAAEATPWLPPAIIGQGGALEGQSVRYFDADPAANGYIAVPEGEGPFPAVLLIHEWNGLVDRVRHLADDMAAQGYIALAVDLYGGRTGANPDENRALMQEVMGDQQKIIDNLDAAARFIRARDDATGRIATIGWCMGGGVALSYAIGGENHDGTAIFYGRLVTDPAQLREIRHPIYGTFAAKDQGIPPAEVAQFVTALRNIGIHNDVHVYDDVDHGFWLWVDQEPAVRAAPALDAWERLVEYLDETLDS
ncbi:MAG TPA: dienelactone hydrolase family protein [Longimicrobiales bacterium]